MGRTVGATPERLCAISFGLSQQRTYLQQAMATAETLPALPPLPTLPSLPENLISIRQSNAVPTISIPNTPSLRPMSPMSRATPPPPISPLSRNRRGSLPAVPLAAPPEAAQKIQVSADDLGIPAAAAIENRIATCLDFLRHDLDALKRGHHESVALMHAYERSEQYPLAAIELARQSDLVARQHTARRAAVLKLVDMEKEHFDAIVVEINADFARIWAHKFDEQRDHEAQLLEAQPTAHEAEITELVAHLQAKVRLVRVLLFSVL